MRNKSAKGAAMVEFAIVATLLMTLLIGIVEFGYVFFVQGTLAGAAREAARDFAINGDPDQASTLAVSMAPGTDLEPIEITYSDPSTGDVLASCPIGKNVMVTIDHKHMFMTGFFNGLLGSSIQLESTGSMRCKG